MYNFVMASDSQGWVLQALSAGRRNDDWPEQPKRTLVGGRSHWTHGRLLS
jgi:hypothetical protein